MTLVIWTGVVAGWQLFRTESKYDKHVGNVREYQGCAAALLFEEVHQLCRTLLAPATFEMLENPTAQSASALEPALQKPGQIEPSYYDAADTRQ